MGAAFLKGWSQVAGIGKFVQKSKVLSSVTCESKFAPGVGIFIVFQNVWDDRKVTMATGNTKCLTQTLFYVM